MQNSEEISLILLQKMIFIYNALLQGWTIKMIESDKFEFTKGTELIKKEVNMTDFLKKFIQYNLSIENLHTI